MNGVLDGGVRMSALGQPQDAGQPGYRDTGLARPKVIHEARADGTLLLRAVDAPVRVDNVGFSSFIARWALERGMQVAFGERCSAAGTAAGAASGPGPWRTLTWSEFHAQMLAVAAGLLELGLSQHKPLMILSGNSLEQAVLLMAAEYVGIPTAPVSPPYSLASRDFTRLRGIHDLVDPAAVFVQTPGPFADALGALGIAPARVIAVNGVAAGQVAWDQWVNAPMTAEREARVHAAHAAIDAVHGVARIFFTSGSTGVPKGVPITYGNTAAVIGQVLYLHQRFADESMVMVDWMPWHHLFAGLGSTGRVVTLGGSYYIDEGRPLPGQFERTVDNLRSVSPTVYITAPAAWALLVAEMERDDALARAFFRRIRYVGYGGASLPRAVWSRFQDVAHRTVGERIVFMSAFGCTETSGQGTQFNKPNDDVGNVGIPYPGFESKLVPLDGGDDRYEVRMRGRHVFPGYLKRDDLTQAAFDDEGFYKLGDAVRLADPASPREGLRYAGRCVEDFKLSNGTWVRTGAVRLALIEQCAPLLSDAVVCGHDLDEVTALAWPNAAACRALALELGALSIEHLVEHPLVVAAVAQKLRSGHSTGASLQVRRVLLMAEPPQSDAHEIADKGYINQSATRQRRAHLVDRLYAAGPDAGIATDH